MTSDEKIKQLQDIIDCYEQNGAAKLFYAINRKMSEMAALMNRTNLGTIELDDKDSKAFDRLFKLLEKSQVISSAAQTIQGFAGITDDEEKDTQYAKFKNITTPEKIANELGDNKVQDV